MNTELPLINDWFKANRLSLNTNKTTFILFCSHRKFVPELTPLILIENTSIPQSKSVKFLGVIVDQHMSCNEHIAQISDIHTHLTRSAKDYRVTLSRTNIRSFSIKTTGLSLIFSVGYNKRLCYVMLCYVYNYVRIYGDLQ